MAIKKLRPLLDTYTKLYFVEGDDQGHSDDHSSEDTVLVKTTNRECKALFQFPAFQQNEIRIKSAKFKICYKKLYMNTNILLYDVPPIVGELTSFNDSFLDSDPYIVSNVLVNEKSTIAQPQYLWREYEVSDLVVAANGYETITFAFYPRKLTGTHNYNDSAIFSSEFENGAYCPQLIIEYEDIVPDKPSIIYPAGEILQNTGNVTFRWKHNAPGTSPQAKYEFGWRMQNEPSWHTVTTASANESYTMGASAFSNGIVEWRVKTFTQKGNASPYATASFFCVGAPAAPVVDFMRSDAITEVGWSANKAEETAAEVEISQFGNILYQSGKAPAGIYDKVRPNLILPNGRYVASVRVSNTHGMWSPWSRREFDIAAAKPAAPVITAANINDHIHISTTAAGAPTLILYRSEDMGHTYLPIEWGITAEWDDYFVQPERTYYYFVRAYGGSYTDSNRVDVAVHYDGYFVSGIENMKKRVQILLSDDEQLSARHSFENTAHLQHFVGRAFPVKESGDEKSESFSLNGFLRYQDAWKLCEIVDGNGVFCIRGLDKYLFCDIADVSLNNNRLHGGYDVGFTGTRIDYEKAVRFDHVHTD